MQSREALREAATCIAVAVLGLVILALLHAEPWR